MKHLKKAYVLWILLATFLIEIIFFELYFFWIGVLAISALFIICIAAAVLMSIFRKDEFEARYIDTLNRIKQSEKQGDDINWD